MTGRARGALLALALLVPAAPGAAEAPAGAVPAAEAEGVAPVAPVAPVDLVGTWHVLVHYRDASAHDPQAWHWDDRVWVFERVGGRLRWTQYPLVVFGDESGRFERRRGGLARVLHAWEPNPAQRAQIRRGLEVNPRGRAVKTLRGSDAEGWSTRARAAASSASIVTFTESWRVEGLPALPVFTQQDVLGGARTEELEGITRYATRRVSAAGDELSGGFERDGIRSGRFRMRRAGSVGPVAGSGETPEQRAARRLRRLGLEQDLPQ